MTTRATAVPDTHGHLEREEARTNGHDMTENEAAALIEQLTRERDEAAILMLGGVYMTQGGERVTMVKIHGVGTHYETLEDETGAHRYSRRLADMGRLTGTAHDYSDPGNIQRPICCIALHATKPAPTDSLVATLRERLERYTKLDSEAATYVESVICMRTHFTGEPPYVGWKGLGLALTETLDRLEAAEKDAERYRWLHTHANVGVFHGNPPLLARICLPVNGGRGEGLRMSYPRAGELDDAIDAARAFLKEQGNG